MKRVLLSLFITIFCVTLTLEARSQEPTLRFTDSMTYDFGEVARKGGDLHHDFEFVNEGSSPLVIIRSTTSCSCVKVKYPKKPIAPKAKAKVEVTYEIHKKELGNFSKVIQIYSTSPEKRQLLIIQGTSIDK